MYSILTALADAPPSPCSLPPPEGGWVDNHGWTISVGVCVQCYIATKGQPLHVASTVTKNDTQSPTGHYHAICATAGNYTSGENSDPP